MKRMPIAQQNARRRGAVVAQVAVMLVVIMGFAALAIDAGSMYSTRAELQHTADAAALAAVGIIMEGESPDGTTLEEYARQIAAEYALKNEAGGVNIVVDPDGDIELGQAAYNAGTGGWDFTPTAGGFNAVRVTTRRTDSSANGSLGLTFAHIFHNTEANLTAQATSMLLPRDLAVVIDISGSMNFDSTLRDWNRNDGGTANLRDIWASLDGPEPSRPYIPVDETESEYADDTGPTYGYMTQWGDPLFPDTYSPSSDAALVYIRRYQSTNDASITANLTSAGYNSAERSALMSSSHDNSSSHFRRRTGVMLGLATWNSGKSGSAFPGGNGDNQLDSWEVNWLPLPDYRASSWDWEDYVWWVYNGNEYRGGNDSVFRYRYGLKTYADFLLSGSARPYQRTDNLWGTPAQPLRAVKDAVQILSDTIATMNTPDRMSLEVFNGTSSHEVSLTDNLQEIPDRLYDMQADHYLPGGTGIGAGLFRATAELDNSDRWAAKMIVLMSDGVANIDEDGNYNTSTARTYAIAEAQRAADKGYLIYTVSVGYGVDRALMQEIAEIGNGREFHADGSPEEYTEELEQIFRSLGGIRPTVLIQ